MTQTGIWAKSILRSRNAVAPQHVLSTLLVRMPRSVLAEWNTHRQFSRNATSTRAIPTEKLIDQVLNDPFTPFVWGKNQKGMQASEEEADPAACCEEWLRGRDRAVETARALLALGLHKQVVGRVLEPWMWTIVCVSATEWSNFLALRDHPDAEPHIAMLAREMRKCLDREDDIQTLQPDEWHTPFVEPADWVDCYRATGNEQDAIDAARKLSVARSASTSYKTVEGFDMTLERAVALHDKLVASTPLHASPCEHVAQADTYLPGELGPYGQWIPARWQHGYLHANFKGFIQYRKQLPGECL